MKLKPNSKLIKISSDVKFGNIIANYLLKKRGQIYTKADRNRVAYNAKLYYNRVINKNLDIIFPEGINEEAEYKKFADYKFWLHIIDFMYSFADENTKDFYSQTINGLQAFYFKHYLRLKKKIENRNIESEDRMLLSIIRNLWKKEDVINLFYCYIVALYGYFNPRAYKKLNLTYYKYCKYLTLLDVPKIKEIVIDNNQLIRGLLIQFIPFLTEWMEKIGKDINTIINLEELDRKKLKGVEIIEEITQDKTLNDIVGDAIEKFVIEMYDN